MMIEYTNLVKIILFPSIFQCIAEKKCQVLYKDNVLQIFSLLHSFVLRKTCYDRVIIENE